MAKEEIINEKRAELNDLISQLTSSYSTIGDWKVIKCYEAKMQEKELPYDLDQLMADREAVRVRIRELEEELNESTAD